MKQLDKLQTDLHGIRCSEILRIFGTFQTCLTAMVFRS